jgi:hypothetical protein
MNPVIFIAIIVQGFVAKVSRLAGAIIGYFITTGVLIWGLSVYEHSGHYIAILFIPFSQPFFILACLVWYGIDTFEFVAALKKSSGLNLRGFRRLLAGNFNTQKKIIVMDKEIKLFQRPDLNSLILERMSEGFEIKKIGFTSKDDEGLTWKNVLLFNGKRGYINEFSRIATMLKAKTINPDIKVYETADANKSQIANLTAGSDLDINEADWGKNDPQIKWILVRLPDGRLGYVDQGLKVELLPPATPEGAAHRVWGLVIVLILLVAVFILFT